MTAPLLLGIDVGTSSVKALLLGADGEVVEVARVEHALHPSPGVVEADADGWWTATREAIAALRSDLSAIVAVGLSGNMSAVVPVDDAGRALRPALLLADPRGAAQIAALDPALLAEIEVAGRNAPSTALSLSSLLWLRDAEPETLARTAAWLGAKDHVRLRLTGEVATEPTDAANSCLLDVASRAWRHDLIERAGLPPRIFPRLLDAGDVAGRVTPAAAAETGLPAGIPVVAGGGDMATAAIGAATTAAGSVCVSLGTSVTVIAALGADPPDPAWRGRLTYHPFPGPADGYALASLLTGGLALNWLRTLAGGRIDFPATVVPDPADPLVFVPQLAGTGTPDFVPEMRGTLLGLTPHTGAPEIVVALFEAIAFEIAAVLATLGGDRDLPIRTTGGGTNVDVWLQILADVLERPVEVLEQTDVSAVGAALLAAPAAGLDLDPTTVARVARRRVPRPEHRSAWARRAARYAEARALALDFHQRNRAGDPHDPHRHG